MPMILHHRPSPASLCPSPVRAQDRVPSTVPQTNDNNYGNDHCNPDSHVVPLDANDDHEYYYSCDEDNHCHEEQQYCHHYQPQEAPPPLYDEDCCDKDHRRGLCKNLEAWYKLVDSASTASMSTSSTSIRSLSGGCFQSAVSGWGSVASRKSYHCLRTLDGHNDDCADASSIYWSVGDDTDSISSSSNYSAHFWEYSRHRREQNRQRQWMGIIGGHPLPPTSSLSLQNSQHPRNQQQQHHYVQSEEEEILAFLQFRERHRTYFPSPEPQVVEWGYFVDTPLEWDQSGEPRRR